METEKINITINENTIQGWIERVAQIKNEIKALQDEEATLRTRLDTWKIFMDNPAHGAVAREPRSSLNGAGKDSSTAFLNMGLPEAIRFLIKQEGGPILRSDLKKRLMDVGYPKERFGKTGNYFYTAIKRMEKSGTVIVDEEYVRLIK